MKTLLTLCAVLESATGLALMVHPPMVAHLLLGSEVSGAGEALGRVAGFAMLSLGVACWPGPKAISDMSRPLRAMLMYNLLAAIYLIYLGIAGESVGILLWPAGALHAVLPFFLVRESLHDRNARD